MTQGLALTLGHEGPTHLGSLVLPTETRLGELIKLSSGVGFWRVLHSLRDRPL